LDAPLRRRGESVECTPNSFGKYVERGNEGLGKVHRNLKDNIATFCYCKDYLRNSDGIREHDACQRHATVSAVGHHAEYAMSAVGHHAEYA